MKNLLIAVLCSGAVFGQRAGDWPSAGGDAQRTGWERSDSRITRDNVNEFKLVLKQKLDNGASGPRATTPPVIIGLLISYRGFKELAFVQGSSNKLWAFDADMDRLFWKRQIEASGASTCAATPALIPPINFAAGRPRPRTNAAPNSPRVGGVGFGASRSVFTVSSDGKMHQINSADGSDQFPALEFLPSGAKATALTLHDGVVYTAAAPSCNAAPNAIVALNLNDADPKPVSFAAKGKGFGGATGFAVASDGTVYAQAESLYALSPKDLKVQDQLDAPNLAGSVTPVLFTWKERDLIATAGSDGTLYLLDAKQPGGADHKTPLFQLKSNATFSGGFASWEDGEGNRWILAPTKNSVVAYKVEQHDEGKPILTETWTAKDLEAPLPPVTTSGVVFVLTGGKRATLQALDAATGKQMWTSGNQVSAPPSQTGLTVANGRVFFTTTDNTLYGFGIFLER
jgi:outer membrane protein assembly factor BamB